MRAHQSIPLRRWLPVAVVALFVALLGGTAFWRFGEEVGDVEENARVLLKHRLANEQYHLQLLLRLQQSELIADEIAQFGSIPEVESLALVDEDGRVLFSPRRADANRPFAEVLPGFSVERFRTAQGNLLPLFDLNPPRASLLAYQPIVLSARSGEIRPRAVGALLVRYDLTGLKRAARDAVLASFVIQLLGAGIVFATFLWILRRWLTQPLTYLHEAVRAISRGDFGTKIAISGSGELADLAAAIDRMQHDLGAAKAERDRSEAARRQSEARLRRIVDSGIVGVFFWDTAGNVLEANDAFLRIVGFTGADVLAGRLRWSELTPPEHRLRDEAALREVAETGVCRPYEKEFFRRDGSRVYVEIGGTGIPERPDHGVSFVLDIAARKAAEESLRVSTKEIVDLKAALDVHAIVAITDPTGRITMVNDKFCAIAGFTRDELLGRNHRILNSGHHPKEFFRDLWSTISRGEVWQGDVRNRAKDGSPYWVATTIVPFLGPDGKPRQYVAIRADITARKQAEELLRQQRERLENIIEATNVGTWEWNVQSGETVFNERWARMVGRTLAELGRTTISTWRELMHPRDLDEAMDMLDRHFVGELDCFDCECRMRHTNGQWIWIHNRGRVVTRSPNGRPLLMFGTHTDITSRKAAEAALRASEAFNVAVLDSLSEHIAVLDSAGVIIAVNRAWREFARLNGAADLAETSVGLNYLGICQHAASGPNGDEAPTVVAGIRDVLAGETEAFQLEYPCHAPGVLRWFLLRASPMVGVRQGVVVSHENITTRKMAEAAMRESEARFRSVFETAPVAIFIQTRGCFGFLNPCARQMFDPRGDGRLEGRPVLDFIHPSGRAVTADRIRRLNEHREPVEVLDQRIQPADGTVVDVQISAVPFVFGGENGALVFARDVTEERRAVERLRLHESVLRETGEIAKVGGWSFDPATGDGYWTEEVARIHDLSPDEATDRENGLRFYEPESRARIEAAIQAAVESGTPYDLQLQLVTAKGNRKWVRTIGHPVVENGQVVRVRGSFQDVTELYQASLALRESEERFRQIAENISEVFWMADETQRNLLYVSPAYDAVWGRSREALLRGEHRWDDAIHPEDRARVAAAAARRPASDRHEETYRILRPGGEVRWIRDRAFLLRDPSGRLLRVIGTAEDITESRDLEQRLRQSQKLEAIGTLAGGIAHDFNNILSGISGFTSLARVRAEGDAEMLEYLDEISHAGMRAADLVRQILAFSRQGSEALVPIQLRHVVDESLRLLRASIPATIKFHAHLPSDLPAVLGNASQIHQIMMNLGTNAWHAMREHGGTLTLGLEQTALGLDRQHGGLVGRYVCLEVSDTGCGMDAATRERIFEPFFTTKKPGEGTGLGLSVVHGIMRAHRGAIEVTSKPGVGTTFQLFFPVASGLSAESAAGTALTPRGRAERVLVVDDEETLARLAAKILTQLGYAAEWRADPVAALEELRAAPDAYDLLITDQTMPGSTGLRLAEQVLRLRPTLPIILMSGFSAELTAERIREVGVREFLLKPLTLHALAQAVRRVLDH